MFFRFGSLAAAGALALVLGACSGGGSGEAALSVSPNSVAVTAPTTGTAPSATLRVTLGKPPERQVYAIVEHTATGLANASVSVEDDRSGEVYLLFRAPDELGPGEYRDMVTLKLCYDQGCAEHLSGSPRQLSVVYNVTGQPAPAPEPAIVPTAAPADAGPLPVVAEHDLPHDVVDAEYSRALDAIVMVSVSPSPALYVYDVTTGRERMTPLASVPAVVSVSPDGRSADVGHDPVEPKTGGPGAPGGNGGGGGAVTHVDLLRVGAPGDVPTQRAVPVRIGDLVADGFGWTHIFPSGSGWSPVYSLNRWSGATAVKDFHTYQTRARLHPGGHAIYGATNGLSPSSIERWSDNQGDLAGGRRSPYHGQYEFCGNLWFSADGKRIYTPCGNVFRSSDYSSQDMTYMGTVALFDPAGNSPRIAALSDSAEAGQLILLEGVPYRYEDCGAFYQCQSRLSIYENQSLTPIASYRVPDVEVNGAPAPQLARFVFHSADGASKYVITWLYPGSEYRLLTVR